MLWVILLIRHDQGQERYSLSCPRRHFQNTVSSRIKSF
jgi:hypothetical protein